MTKREAVTLLNIIGEDGRKQRPGVAAKQQPTEPSTTKKRSETMIHREAETVIHREAKEIKTRLKHKDRKNIFMKQIEKHMSFMPKTRKENICL